MGRVRVDTAFNAKGRWVLLDDLTGYVETSVQGTGTPEVVGLLDRLLVDASGAAARPGEAATLTAPERDRVLAGLYATTYGENVETTVSCSSCGSRFDLDFSLADLVESLPLQSANAFDERGCALFTASDGTVFRLPTGADESSVLGLDSQAGVRQLLDRCIVERGEGYREADLQEAMASVGPVIDTDLPADCPECGTHQEFHFDLQHYVMSALLRDRTLLAAEVHELAKAYGWSFADLMSMPRTLRKTFVSIASGATPSWQV